jgi:hypothetical protein
LINEYIDGTSPKTIQEFVNKKMKSITNLKYDRILSTLELFSNDWKNEFANKISEEEKAALNSIVSNRNNISHGDVDVISFEIMKAYYIHAKSISILLKKIIKK